MVIHDETGEYICCRILVQPGMMKVDEGEAWGVVEAAKWALNLGFTRVLVESDSKRVLEALQSNMGGGTVLWDFIASGMRFFAAQEHLSISWACRSANMVAHTITRTSRNFDSPHFWIEPLNSVVFAMTDPSFRNNRCVTCA